MMTPLQQRHETLHLEISKRNCHAGLSILISSIAFAVIFCAGLCCLIPGINALNQIILPAIVPASAILLCTLPGLLKLKQSPDRKPLLQETQDALDAFVPITQGETERERATEIKTHLLEQLLLSNKSLYTIQFLNDLQKKYPKREAEQSADQKIVLKGIQYAIRHLNEIEDDDQEEI
jgi:hypothetical protein